jgi:hypothetical protein
MISLRQMPAGQWVAFEGMERHICARPTVKRSESSKATIAPPKASGTPLNVGGFEDFEMPSTLEPKWSAKSVNRRWLWWIVGGGAVALVLAGRRK